MASDHGSLPEYKNDPADLGIASSQSSGNNLVYLEILYDEYLKDPLAVPETWRNYFRQLKNGDGIAEADVGYATLLRRLEQQVPAQRHHNGTPAEIGVIADTADETRGLHGSSYDLAQAYRIHGHKAARINPLEYRQRRDTAELDNAYKKLLNGDPTAACDVSSTFLPVKGKIPLNKYVGLLKQTYCGSIGAEFIHIDDRRKRKWLKQKMENAAGHYNWAKPQKRRILGKLIAAAGLEHALAAKYPGTKRFGLEGGEALIPLTDYLVQSAGEAGCKEIVIGMAHRGRLNMLVNIFGKSPKSLFDEFEGKIGVGAPEDFGGDVKYHQGISSNLNTEGGAVHMALAFNPSHLEIVIPVLMGSVRARQDRRKDSEGKRVLPIAIHGDAAFSGQGVVMESLQMSQLRGFHIGGTVHIILDNQIGFTTSLAGDARSTFYATDIAKFIGAPIFHVNGDDPEALLFAGKLALEYRAEFHSDVVIDLICYRKYGHNEADEPAITQPRMYRHIKRHPGAVKIYADKLIAESVISEEDAEMEKESYREKLDNNEISLMSLTKAPNKNMFVDWDPYLGHKWENQFDTGVDAAVLNRIGKKLETAPKDWNLHRTVRKVLGNRKEMRAGKRKIDWGYAELLAYGTLVDAGFPVRISGQDSRRGTFSHRHAVLHEQDTGDGYCNLGYISKKQGNFQIFDSYLSEEAAMAFEYGYATTRPDGLVVWEAQFGDFANGAQVVIDQFLSSGESKWMRLCGLVLLLPHGYEGQGPEHSSARLERFLQLCAGMNMQVCVPSTAAQVFHMLRRQVVRPLRKPLVVMMPKSLLRKEEAASDLEELTRGGFKPVIGCERTKNRKDVRRVVLCSGKVYYELIQKKREDNFPDAEVVRIEQVYPFPHEELKAVLRPFKNVDKIVWCQEEPKNQGAWYSSKHHLEIAVRDYVPNAELQYAGREASSSPATGYNSLHHKQQMQLVEAAFTE